MPKVPEKPWSPQPPQNVLVGRGLSVQSPRCLRTWGRGLLLRLAALSLGGGVFLPLLVGPSLLSYNHCSQRLCPLARTSVLLTVSAHKSYSQVQGVFAGEQRSLRLAAKLSPWLHEGVTTTVCPCWQPSTPAPQPRLCVYSALWGWRGGVVSVSLQLEGSLTEILLQASVVIHAIVILGLHEENKIFSILCILTYSCCSLSVF